MKRVTDKLQNELKSLGKDQNNHIEMLSLLKEELSALRNESHDVEKDLILL